MSVRPERGRTLAQECPTGEGSGSDPGAGPGSSQPSGSNGAVGKTLGRPREASQRQQHGTPATPGGAQQRPWAQSANSLVYGSQRLTSQLIACDVEVAQRREAP